MNDAFEGVDDWMATRVGRAIPLPDGFVPRGGFGDPVHMIRIVVPREATQLGGVAVALIYDGDEHGETRRTVRLKRGWFDRSILYVSGYCELRREPRTFRGDRMREIIDWRTGEVHVDALSFFAEFGLSEKPLISRDVYARIRQGAIVLMALANADGDVHQDEIEAILRFADEVALGADITLDKFDLRRIARALHLMRPDREDLAEALAAARADPAIGRPLRRAMRSLVVSDDRITIEETQMLEACLASLAV